MAELLKDMNNIMIKLYFKLVIKSFLLCHHPLCIFIFKYFTLILLILVKIKYFKLINTSLLYCPTYTDSGIHYHDYRSLVHH